MALFASPFGESTFYGPERPFKNLFRMLDEFDTYNRQQGTNEAGGERSKRPTAVRTFNPKFDVRERDEDYVLHGELPGFDRDQINIQFTEPQTLVISGHMERSYTSGNPPAGLLEQDSSHGATEQDDSHRARVEDAPADEDDSAGNNQLAKSNTSQAKKAGEKGQQQQHINKIWLWERLDGAFTRTFGFPTQVDHDGVKASLEKGVLTIIVPKMKKQEARQITIT
jgi:HSP20 family molecular chaperone IbpA